MGKKSKIYILFLLFSGLIFVQNIFAINKPFSLSVGLFGASAAPQTDNFKYHSKGGGAGGVIATAGFNKYLSTLAFVQISSFPEKSYPQYDPHQSPINDIVVSAGIGGRFGLVDTGIKIFGEGFITINFVGFSSYTNYDRPREVGYQGMKMGLGYGLGAGYKYFVVGYRRINAGGGDIIYSSLYAEFTIPLF